MMKFVYGYGVLRLCIQFVVHLPGKEWKTPLVFQNEAHYMPRIPSKMFCVPDKLTHTC